MHAENLVLGGSDMCNWVSSFIGACRSEEGFPPPQLLFYLSHSDRGRIEVLGERGVLFSSFCSSFML